MARYLFTLHTYASWLADREEGWTDRRVRGTKRTSPELGRRQRASLQGPVIELTPARQSAAIEAAREAAAYQRFALYSVGSSRSHLHLLLGYSDDREPASVRASVKRSLEKHLRPPEAITRFFSEGGNIFRVAGRRKFDFFHDRYLPNHPGWYWSSKKGLRPPTRSEP